MALVKSLYTDTLSTNNFMLVEVFSVNSFIVMKGSPSFLVLLTVRVPYWRTIYAKSQTSFTKFSSSKTKCVLQLQGLFYVVSLTMEKTLHRKLASTGKIECVFLCSLAYFISYTIPKVPMPCFWTGSLYTFWTSLSMYDGAPFLYRMSS